MSKLTIIASKDMVRILESLVFSEIRRKGAIKVSGTRMEELR